MAAKSTNAISLHLRLRIVCGEKIALGPGKVELLALIEETGSLGKAAQRMVCNSAAISALSLP